MGLIDKSRDRSQQQKNAVEKSCLEMKKMKDTGLIVDSDRYGKIAIDIDKKVRCGPQAAKSFGCGLYLVWNPKEQGFFISSSKPITDKLP